MAKARPFFHDEVWGNYVDTERGAMVCFLH